MTPAARPASPTAPELVADRLRWAEVDLSAIAANVATLRRLIPPPTRLGVVVKANAYGHDARLVAPSAVAAGADWLLVGTVREAMDLRHAGVVAPILIMGRAVETAGLPDAVAAEVRLCVYDRESIEAAAAAARRVRRPALLHLKLDSGMHRLGATAPEGVELARLIGATDEVRLEALWTHFAEADEEVSRRTAAQLAAFQEAVAAIESAGLRGSDVILHAANSAAALLHPETRLDLVRCGLPVYGYAPSPALPDLGLRPALAWRARVVALHDLVAGDRVGYGGTWEAERPTRIAAISVGYADGYHRALSDRASVLIGGRRAPVVGRVSMDFITADVGALPEVRVGDEVTLIGRQGDQEIGAGEMADWLSTIVWEVLCTIGRRVDRVAIHDSGPPHPGPGSEARGDG